MIAINLNSQNSPKQCSILVCEHSPPRSRSAYHVEVFARLRGAFRIDRFHDTFQDVEGREATNASTVKAEEIELLFCNCHDGFIF